MDQGSVVVLRRRAFQFATLPGHPDMDRDLSYSGSIPTATTLIPDHRGRDFSQPTCDQGSVLVHNTKTD